MEIAVPTSSMEAVDESFEGHELDFEHFVNVTSRAFENLAKVYCPDRTMFTPSTTSNWMKPLGIGSVAVGITLMASAVVRTTPSRNAITCLVAGIGFSAFGIGQLAVDVLGDRLADT